MNTETYRSHILPDNVSPQEVEKLLDLGCDVVINPLGDSMIPYVFPERDSIIIHREKNYCPGEIVMVKIDKIGYAIYRLLSVSPDGNVLISPDVDPNTIISCRLDDVRAKITFILKHRKIKSPVSSGKNWRRLPTFVREIVLANYRRKKRTLTR